jgi:hypothetical protein
VHVQPKKGKSHSTKKSIARGDSELKLRQERIKEFERETRWLPNSAFKTYFGKPAFEAYGMNNTNTPGPILEGAYLKSHNIMPHADGNHPKRPQSFKSALLKAE